jgi:signal transduction histidine kinase/GAF domain-containing protein
VVEVAVLEEVAEIFASLRDVDAVLARFLALARNASGGNLGAIYLRDDARGEFVRWRESAETPTLNLPAALVEWFFEGIDHRTVALDDPRFDGIAAIELSRKGGVCAAVGLPMRIGARLVGFMGLGFSSVAHIPVDKLPMLSVLARFPAAAIEHARTQAIADRRAHLANGLRRFGEHAVRTLDIGALHHLILDATVELTGSDQASITHVLGGVVRVVAGVGKDAALVGTTAPAEMMREALETDEPYVVDDVAAADPAKLLVRLAKRNGAGSFMALAMRHQDRVFGHLFAGAVEAHRYPPETVEAMRILASMAAAALEQRSAHADAERQAGRLTALIEHLPMYIEVYDGSGALVRGNGVARVLRERFGMGSTPTAQRPCGDLTIAQRDGAPISPDELPAALALRGIHAPRREVVVTRDGQKLATVMMAAAPIFAPDGGTVESVVLACQDVSALHELAQEKDRFLSVAAHELRTPLTALHATTQLVEVDPAALDDAARRAQVLARIRRQTGRLVRLVEQLLDSVRVQSGELLLKLDDVDLVTLCRDVVEMSLPADGPRAIVVADGPVVGRWDPVRLEQVVTNLLSNAARYSPKDGEVTVRVHSEGGRAFLAVRDAGIGIPEGQRGMVFTPFFRGANAQRSHAGGLGLGLHIAQEIVRRHGGSIRVESAENAGTTFTVELPLES